MRRDSVTAVHAKLVLTAVFWGGTFVAGRVIAREVPPFSAALARFLVASGVLWGFLFATRRSLPRVRPKDLGVLLLLGLTGVFAYNACFFLGLRSVSASRASVIIATNPVLIALFSAGIFGERLGSRRALGIALALAGAVVVVGKGRPWELISQGVGHGDGFILGCVASWVAYSLLGKVVLGRVSPLVGVAYACLFGAGLLVPPALGERFWAVLPAASPSVWAGLLYLGVCGTALGFIWYYEGIRSIGPSRAGVFINLVPVSGVLLAFVLLDERMEPSFWLGAGLVAIGLWLANQRLLASRPG